MAKNRMNSRLIEMERLLLYNSRMTERPQFNILAVDDERLNLILLNRILTPEYALFTAKTGREAVSRALTAPPDLVLLDLVLPDMSGFDVLRELKSAKGTADVPVIIITGLDGAADRERGAALGAAGYIAKPFARETVLSNVKACIAQCNKCGV